MNLAAILLISISCLGSSPRVVAHANPLPSTAGKSAKAQSQASAPQGQTQTPSPATPASPAPATTPKRRRHKKKVVANCDTASTTPAASNASGAGGSTTDEDGTKSPSAGTVTPQTNCPPLKIVVRQGGTSDPSIQLAGGATNAQTSQQRATANQLLESTEENLKKAAGKQMSADQQDMVNQIRQFMEQSRAAATAGDLERARTLAWKAQVLSDDLVKPKQ